jgi:hypothetical protein
LAEQGYRSPAAAIAGEGVVRRKLRVIIGGVIIWRGFQSRVKGSQMVVLFVGGQDREKAAVV